MTDDEKTFWVSPLKMLMLLAASTLGRWVVEKVNVKNLWTRICSHSSQRSDDAGPTAVPMRKVTFWRVDYY
jgi:hypothetical protein